MREVVAGVWHWTAPHPEWVSDADWPELVSSYAIDDGEHLLLIDPIAPEGVVDELAVGRTPAVVLTCPWHERDARGLAVDGDLPVFTPAPEEGSSDLSWLPASAKGHLFQAGENLPVGVHSVPGLRENDLVLWIEARKALVFGDTLIDRGDGLVLPREWVDESQVDDILAGLRILLQLPVELVLPTHGEPTDRAALERALG